MVGGGVRGMQGFRFGSVRYRCDSVRAGSVRYGRRCSTVLSKCIVETARVMIFPL